MCRQNTQSRGQESESRAAAWKQSMALGEAWSRVLGRGVQAEGSMGLEATKLLLWFRSEFPSAVSTLH